VAAPPQTRLALALAERERRRQVAAEAREAVAAVVAKLREPQESHPKQKAANRSPAKRRAILATRRSGKTSGGNREDVARCLEQPGYRCTYCNATRAEAKKLAWRSDTQDGWLDLLAEFGIGAKDHTFVIGGVTATPNETELTVTFSNGSQLEIFAADQAGDAEKFRGRAKHRVRIDEAQKWRDLQHFVTAIVGPALRDYDGEVEMDGTPGEDCSGYFYEATKPADHGERLVGWEVHEFGVTDNPYFGSTAEERWNATAAVALVENGWTGEEPAFQREWLGKWVRAGANFVYAVHEAPQYTLTYAPVRMSDAWRKAAAQIAGIHPSVTELLSRDGFYDHERSLDDLPRKPNGRPQSWMFMLGCDFGSSPDPMAMAVLAISPNLPDVFEMFSWKQLKLMPDDWRVMIELTMLLVSDGLIGIVGDPGGLAGANMTAWRERMNLPIEDSDKAGKKAWQDMMNGDIRRARFRYRDDSKLLHEHRHLMRLPALSGKVGKEHDDRVLPDGSVPGRDCSDSALYAYRYLTHHLHRDELPKEGVLVRQEVELEAAAEQRTGRARRRQDDDADDDDGWMPLDR
jgi:hypothetical protein